MRLGVLGSMAAAVLLEHRRRRPGAGGGLGDSGRHALHRQGVEPRRQLLFSTFDMDAARREARRARINGERLTDTLRAHAAGRAEDASFNARYDAIDTAPSNNDAPHGTLWVTPLDDEPKPTSVGLLWREGDTRFDLPDGFDSLSEVPKGVELRLKVRTGETDQPLALRVSVKGLDPMIPLTATATITATAPVTVTGTPEIEPTSVVTATQAVTGTSTALPTPTVVVTATAQATDVPLPSETATAGVEDADGKVPYPLLEGIVEQIWSAADGSGPIRCSILSKGSGRRHEIDLSGLSADQRARIQTGGTIKLRVKYDGDDESTGFATAFVHFNPENCSNNKVLGTVVDYREDDVLSILTDSGARLDFHIGPDASGERPQFIETVKVGVKVLVEYKKCGGPTSNRAMRITGDRSTATADATAGEPFSKVGAVMNDPIDDGHVVRFDLLVKVGASESQWGIEVATGDVKGTPKLQRGQMVRVDGRLVDRDRHIVAARAVTFIANPRPATATPQPTDTSEPPSPTVDPTDPPTPEPTTVGAGAGTPEPPLEPGTAEPTAAPTALPTPALDAALTTERPFAGAVLERAASPSRGAVRAPA
ncbi:MAG: hypothetical protein U0470_06440 [Anaerolineae bacterium]